MAEIGKRGKDICWHEDWLIENYYSYPTAKACAEAYNKQFGTNIGQCVITHKCVKLGLIRGYTDEQVEWLSENYPSNGLKKCTEMFNIHFNQHRTSEGIRRACEVNGIKVSQERKQLACSSTQRHMPVGTIRTHKGYKEIKVSDDVGKHTKNWMLLHQKIWEDHHGKLANDEVVVFLDGNKENCSIENLIAIPKSMQGVMCGYGLFSIEPTLTRANIEWCKLRQALIDNGVNVRQLVKEII